jgi:hypothetical protein
MIRANMNEVKFEGSFVMISAEFCELAGAYKNLIKKKFPEITEEKAREMVIKKAEVGMMDTEELRKVNKKMMEKVYMKLQKELFGELFGEEENE